MLDSSLNVNVLNQRGLGRNFHKNILAKVNFLRLLNKKLPYRPSCAILIMFKLFVTTIFFPLNFLLLLLTAKSFDQSVKVRTMFLKVKSKKICLADVPQTNPFRTLKYLLLQQNIGTDI